MSAIIDRIWSVAGDAVEVLVVDDVLPIVEEMLTLLELTNVPAAAATSLDEAVSVLNDCPNITVVICDVRLSKESGIDLIGRVKADRALAARPLRYVFMTGDPMGIDQIPEGVDPTILTKPVLPRELIALLGGLLQERERDLG